MTSLNVAIEVSADFTSRFFRPALQRAIESGNINEELLEALEKAIALSKSAGPAGKIGDSMVSEVALTILFESMPKA